MTQGLQVVLPLLLEGAEVLVFGILMQVKFIAQIGVAKTPHLPWQAVPMLT